MSDPNLLASSVGRNGRCSCGSGLKYKDCHGSPMFVPPRNWKEDLKWGLKHALGMATFFTILVLVLPVGLGKSRALKELGMPLQVVIAAYYGFGVIAGVALGLLRPLTVKRSGGALVGSVIAFLIYGGGLVALYGSRPWEWPFLFWVVLVIFSCGLGSVVGIAYWNRRERSRRH
jgi:hypothetical protein